MKEQQSVIVKGTDTNALDRLLAKGWLVANMCPMPSSITTTRMSENYHIEKIESHPPQCLVIVEREKSL